MRYGGHGRFIAMVVMMSLATGWGWSSPPTPRVGMVTDVVGRAFVKQGESAWRPLGLLTWISSGSRVRVDAGSRLTVTTTNGATRLHLAGPCEALVDGMACRVLAGGAMQLRVETTPKAAAVPLPDGVNLDRMGGSRRALIEWTMDPACLDPRPVLAWHARTPFEEVEVLVEEARTHQRVFKTTVPGTKSEVTLPPDFSLIPGTDYHVYVTGFPTGGGRVPSEPRPHLLHVVDAATAGRIAAAHTRAMEAWKRSQEDISPMSSLFWVYVGHGLFRPAAEVALVLEKARPDDTGLREFLEVMRKGEALPPRPTAPHP